MKNIYSNQRGMALAFSLIFLALITAFIGIYISVAFNGLLITNKSADLKRAYYMADAGISNGIISLRSYVTAPSTFNVSNGAFAIGNGKNGSYSVDVVSDNASWPTFTLTSTGSYNGMSKVLQLRVQRVSFSRFAYLSNTEIHPTYGNLWWITGMITNGPVFTNGQFNMYGDPEFNGAVGQVSSTINYYNGGPPNDDPAFNGGLTLNAPSTSLPSASILTSISTAAAASGGMSLTGNTTIVFNADGTMNVTNSAKGWSNTNMAAPTNKAIYVAGGNATVKGVMNGQVTLATDQSIYINGHITYNNNPTTNPSSTDLVGLIAKNDITVTTSAPNNLEIDAVLVALNGSFQVDQFWSGARGNMVQYGGLINNVSGPTGTFNPSTGTLTGGYNQLQYYDTRLQSLVPPWFPPASDASGRPNFVKLSLKELS